MINGNLQKCKYFLQIQLSLANKEGYRYNGIVNILFREKTICG